jgi:hypothetical protein
MPSNVPNGSIVTRAWSEPSLRMKIVGYLAAVWYLGFAALSVWDLVTRNRGGRSVRRYASVITG